MKWDRIESQWTEFSVAARGHWPKLTADDWEAMTGTKGHLVGRIQKRYGITRDEAQTQVDDWSDALMDSTQPSGTH